MSIRPRWAIYGAVLLLCCSASSAGASPGQRDLSFGRNGLVHIDMGGTDYAQALIVERSSRIVVAGESDVEPPRDSRRSPGQLDLAVARWMGDGRLDRGFGGDGRVTLDLGGHETLGALARQPDGKLILAGVSQTPGPRYALTVSRLSEDGRPDPGFAGAGTARVTVGDGSRWVNVNLVEVLPDGALLIAGRSGADELVFARLRADGSPDASLGPGGVATARFGPAGSAPSAFLGDRHGGIIVGGSGPAAFLDAPRTALLQRFTTDGRPDATFGVGGVADLGVLTHGRLSLTLQRGALVAAVPAPPSGSVGRLVRVTSAGVVDRTFGENGSATTIAPVSLASDPAGRLIVGGTPFPGTARYLFDGSPDRRFRGLKPPNSEGEYVGSRVAPAPGRKIVAAGRFLDEPPADVEPPDYDFGLVRMHGGRDVRRPLIKVSRSPRGCVGRTLRMRLEVLDESNLSRVVVRLDGRRVHSTRRRRSSMRLRRLTPGRHVVVIRARDSADNQAVRRVRFRRCN